MDSPPRKSNKIRDIVRLQQILKKWKKVANANAKKTSISSSSSYADVAAGNSTSSSSGGGNRSIKFLKKTLSFSESSSSSLGNSSVPKGYIAVCVGKEEKRFVIPTNYLSHQIFGILLREAEEEFGFQQQGVLKLPCHVEMFEKILNMMEVDEKNTTSTSAFLLLHRDQDKLGSDCPTAATINCSPDTELTTAAHRQYLSQSQLCK